MAGDWMKIELELPDKPEVHRMAEILKLDPLHVLGGLVKVWQWFDKHTINGNATGVTYLLLDRITGVTNFGQAMMEVDWMEQNDKVLTMPKFDRHTSESAKQRALTAKRVAKIRNAAIVTKSLPEKRREEKNKTPIAVSDKSHPAIEFDFSTGEFRNVNGQIEIWKVAYPAVTLQTELAKAAAWLIANPKNKKSNYAKFLTNWFNRAQDKARPKPKEAWE
jgi:hypothetical protein